MLSPASPSFDQSALLPVLHLIQLPSIPFGQFTTGASDYSGEQPISAECF